MSRYSAFISYSHSEARIARWLHHALEGYRLPKGLAGSPSPFGPVPRRLPPVFRDRDELPASGDLGRELRGALADSRFQIVLCSPRAAASKWVQEEVLAFKRVHGETRTLALIVGGEPYAGGDEECFPAALRFRLDPAGRLSDIPAEPIAADLRPGKDGRRLALLKLVAGIAGVPLDALVRRDAARRQRRLLAVTAAALAVAVVTIGLAIYAEQQRRVAVSQRLLAERSLEFLIGTFALANPATENPRTITAITILQRASQRAAAELRDEPIVSARLLRTTGEIFFNLGLDREAERDLRAALALEPPGSEGRARAWLKLAALALARADAKASAAAIVAARAGVDRGAAYAPTIDAMAMLWQAKLDRMNGDYARSADRFAAASRAFQALTGDFREELAFVWMSQAQVLVQLRRHAEADPLFRKAVETYRARFGTDHVQTATAIQNQSWADFENGRLDSAERGIAQAVAIYGRVLERDHPTVADALLLEGRIRTGRGNIAGARAALAEARTIFVKLYGPNNAAVGDADFYVAEALARAGDTAGALRRAANVKRIYDAAYGPDDPDQVELLLLKSRILAGGGRLAEARTACTSAAALQERLDPRDPALAATRQSCATLGARPETLAP
jgi:tetratricopeptide (TPR) repeat protein